MYILSSSSKHVVKHKSFSKIINNSV